MTLANPTPPPSEHPLGARSIDEVLRLRAALDPEKLAFTFLADGKEDERRLTYGELDARARAIAARLQSMGLDGGLALLVYPPGLEFIAGFFGCLYAGTAAVPAYPPDRDRPERTLPRLRSIARDAGCRVILTTSGISQRAEHLLPQAPELASAAWLPTDLLLAGAATDWRQPPLHDHTMALLQYTSGSTAEPKGVMVTHANLMHNSALIARAIGFTGDHVGVSWLPMFHDMGLIGMILQPVYSGFAQVLFGTLDFLRWPMRWLEVLSRYGGCGSGAPDFAYALCARMAERRKLEDMDLSGWTSALNAAEPVRAETLEHFSRVFAKCGFRPEAFYPTYGLAENTLIVTGAPRGTMPRIRTLSRTALAGGRVADPTDDDDAVRLVSNGPPLGDQILRIVDPELRTACRDGCVGEIWVSGQSVAAGYWNREALSEETFRARIVGTDGDLRFLRTGDLGFVEDGELYVTGRLKDLIILNGRNHYPQDIEATVEAVSPAFRPSSCVAFAVDHQGQERLAVLAEVKLGRTGLSMEELASQVRSAVRATHGISVCSLALLKPRAILKTSSGKVQRSACRKAFLSGALEVLWRWSAETASAASEDATRRVAQAASSEPPSTRTLSMLAASLRSVRASVTEVDPHRPLDHYGLESVELVALSGEVSARLGRDLPATFFYDHPTLAEAAAVIDGVERSAGSRGESAAQAPIAIIGMGCRFPGHVQSPEDLWQLLLAGTDAISEVPPERWDVDAYFDPDPGAPGKMYTRWGGFLDDVDRFDAEHFGIAPREARAMDPQQRLLLECAWEALERGGVGIDQLHGSDTGVFIGICGSDYGGEVLSGGSLEAIDAYTGTGSALSVAAGRIAYVLGARGPTMSIDTACSSSLVALHTACQAIRAGECTQALVGGVNLVLDPSRTVYLSRLEALSPSGRCRTFSAEADGYVRSDGCAVVVLKPLAAALRDGDPICAVVRGTAVNQDGRSQGLTAPSGASQQQVVRSALQSAGLAPHRVGYVECHGTGTPLGDPIEVHALGSVLAEGRPADAPVILGSVKSYIGHTEGAAGIAGLLGAVLSLQHGCIPATLHARELNPHIDWDRLPVAINREPSPWPRGAEPRIAGVSSFGFSGTNAHAVLEEAPARPVPAPDGPQRPAHLLLLSAHTPHALEVQGRRLRAHLRDATVPLADVCHTLAVGRAALPERLAIVCSSPADIELGTRIRARTDAPVVAFAVDAESAPSEAVVTHLRQCAPVFAEAYDAASSRGEESGRATCRGLWALWRSWGVAPQLICGDDELVEALAAEVGARATTLDACAAADVLVWLAADAQRPGMAAASAASPCEHLPSLAAGRDPWHTLLSALGRLWTRGVSVDWQGFDAPYVRRRVALPTYPFERRSHWHDEPRKSPPVASDSPWRYAYFPATHTLLPGDGHLVRLALEGPCWEELRSHRVYGEVVVAGATYVSWMLALGAALAPNTAVVLSDTTFLEAAVFGSDDEREMYLEARPRERHRWQVRVLSRRHDRWVVHATTELRAADQPLPRPDAWELGAAIEVSDAELQARLRASDLTRDPPWRWTRQIRANPHIQTLRASMQPPALWRSPLADAPVSAGLLDNGFGLTMAIAEQAGTVRVPFHIERLVWDGSPLRECEAFSRIHTPAGAAPSQVRLDVEFCRSGSDTVALRVDGLSVRHAPRELFLQVGDLDLYERSALLLDAPEHPREVTICEPPSVAVAPTGDGSRTLLVRWPSYPGTADGVEEATLAALRWLQIWIAGEQHGDVIWLTEDAVGVDTDAAPNPATAAIWGIGRTMQVEHPELTLQLVDVPASSRISDLLPSLSPTEPQQLWRDGRMYALSLRPTRRQVQPSPHPLVGRTGGTVLITGGTSGLGQLCARHLVTTHGVEHLVLLSRRGASAPGAAALGRSLRDDGAVSVRFEACDVGNRTELEAALGRIDPPLVAVLHAAGVSSDGRLAEQDEADVARVMGAKVRGAMHLDQLTRGLDLAAFVLFSSVAGTFGSPGQASYAAANAALDALAEGRARAGLAALSVAWGPWSEVGMAARLDEAGQARWRRGGLLSIEPDAGLALLDAAMERDSTTLVAAKIDRARAPAPTASPSLLRALVEAPVRGTRARPAQEDLSGALRQLDPEARRERLVQLVTAEVAVVLATDADRLGPGDSLMDKGIDSLMSVELRTTLAGRLGVALPVSLILENDTIDGIVAYVDGAIAAHAAQRTSAERPPEPAPPMLQQECGAGPLHESQYFFWCQKQYTVDISLRLRTSGEIDIRRLTRALHQVVASRPVLRAPIEDHHPRRHASQPAASSCVTHVYHPPERALDEAELQDEFRRWVAAPLGAALGPLVKFQIHTLPGGETEVWHQLSHAVADNWTVVLFWTDLHQAYLGRPLAPRELIYDLPSRDEATYRAGRDFWRSYLSDIPRSPFPREILCSRDTPPRRTEPVKLPASAWQQIRQSLPPEDTPFILEAAAVRAWHRLTGLTDFRVNTVRAGRPTPVMRGVYGPLMDLVPIRIRSIAPDARSQVTSLKEEWREVGPHTSHPIPGKIVASPGFAALIGEVPRGDPPLLGDTRAYLAGQRALADMPADGGPPPTLGINVRPMAWIGRTDRPLGVDWRRPLDDDYIYPIAGGSIRCIFDLTRDDSLGLWVAGMLTEDAIEQFCDYVLDELRNTSPGSRP